MMAARLSAARGHLSTDDTERLAGLLQRHRLPTHFPITDKERTALLAALHVDKKRDAQGARWVLLSALGRSFVTRDVSQRDVVHALAEICPRARGPSATAHKPAEP